MHHASKRAHCGWLLLLLLPLSGLVRAENYYVEIFRDKAPVRSQADYAAKVITFVFKNMRLECTGREGDWYQVILPAEYTGQPTPGYVHQSMAKIVTGPNPAVPTTGLAGTSAAIAGKAKPFDGPSRFSLGMGFGIPFGTLGFNAEFNPILTGKNEAISEYFSVNIGAGFALVGPGYSFGLRIYPLGRKKPYQPRFSIQYGVVGIYNWKYMMRGFSIGGGTQYKLKWLKGQLSGEAELIFILNYFGYHNIDFIDRIKISVGLRRHFE